MITRSRTPPTISAGGRLHGANESVQRGNDEKHDWDVGETNSREGHKSEHRRHHERRDKRRSSRCDLRNEQIENEDDTDAGECRRQPGRELVVAEHGKRGGLRPVEQDGFFETRDAVQVRGHEVATREHLTRGFGKSRLVRFPERSISESSKDGEAGDDQEGNEIVRTRSGSCFRHWSLLHYARNLAGR